MATATKTETAAFKLDDSEVEELTRRTRTTTLHYQDEVKAAVKSGDTLGIKVADKTEGNKVQARLRATAKSFGVKLQVSDRAETKGYVAFKYVAVEGDGASKLS